VSDTSIIAAWPFQSVPGLRLSRIQSSMTADLERICLPSWANEALAVAEVDFGFPNRLDVLDAASVAERFMSAYQVWCEEQFTRRGRSASGLSEGSVIQGWGKSSWREQLVAEISAYSLHEPGWDGYSARAIDHAAIVDAITFVRQLPDDLPSPLDQPCSDGEVSLVWRQGERFAEIGFGGGGTFWWYSTDGEREDGGEDLLVGQGIPTELGRIMGFLTEESAPIKAPWGELFFSEWVLEQGTESSRAPSAYGDLPTQLQFRIAA